MKILLIGLGSIGRRHLNTLKSIGGLDLAALRTLKGALTKPEPQVKEFFDLKDALAFRPNGVIISNPTSLHISSAIDFLKTGIKVLIEKPISNTIKEAQELESFQDNLRVAYCFRFLPVYQKLEEVIREEKPFKIGFKRSYFLPKWHPYTDYRREYVAQKTLGGGVLRTLSHEIDLAVKWFGEPQSVNGITDKVSFLEMNTDDYAFLSLKTAGGSRVNYELDLFSPVSINHGEMYTSKGRYHWDIHQIRFQSYVKEKDEAYYTSEDSAIETMYLEQMKDFVSFLKTGDSANATYQEAVQTMRIIETIEKY